MPGGGRRPGLGFAVADDAGHEQIGVVQRGAEGRAQRVAQFAPLVDRAGNRRAEVAGKPTRPGEGAHEALETVSAVIVLGVELAERPLQVEVGQVGGGAVAGTGDQEHVGFRARGPAG